SSGEDDKKVRERADAVGKAIRAAMPSGCRLLGPSPCEVERVQAMFRRHLLLFAKDNRTMAAWLAAAAVKPGLEKNVRIGIDVDPFSML
ncbi:MAG: hypothetical protein LIP23_05720, partial [Planctomycetes bacterium]|nr:hypothetical protein [Planctomycetota bacterium]